MALIILRRWSTTAMHLKELHSSSREDSFPPTFERVAKDLARRPMPFPSNGWQVKDRFTKAPHEYFREWQRYFSPLAYKMIGIIINKTTGKNQSKAPISNNEFMRLTGASKSHIHRAKQELFGNRGPVVGERPCVKGVTVENEVGGRSKGGFGMPPIYSWSRDAINLYVQRCREEIQGQRASQQPGSAIPNKGPTCDTLRGKRRVPPAAPPTETNADISSRSSNHHHRERHLETKAQNRAPEAATKALIPERPQPKKRIKTSQVDDDEPPRTPQEELVHRLTTRHGADSIVVIEVPGLVRIELEKANVPLEVFLAEDSHRTTNPQQLKNPLGYYRNLAKNVVQEERSKWRQIQYTLPDETGTTKCVQCQGGGFKAPAEPCDCALGRDVAKVRPKRAGCTANAASIPKETKITNPTVQANRVSVMSPAHQPTRVSDEEKLQERLTTAKTFPLDGQTLRCITAIRDEARRNHLQVIVAEAEQLLQGQSLVPEIAVPSEPPGS